MCDFTGFIKISKRSKVQPYTVPIQYTVYGYGPKATILTKLTTTAASTTDSYKTHFLKNNIQTSYQDSFCSSTVLNQEHITLLRHRITTQLKGGGVTCMMRESTEEERKKKSVPYEVMRRERVVIAVSFCESFLKNTIIPHWLIESII